MMLANSDHTFNSDSKRPTRIFVRMLRLDISVVMAKTSMMLKSVILLKIFGNINRYF